MALLWLGLEDTHSAPVAALGLSLAVLAVAHFAEQRAMPWSRSLTWSLLGASTGALTALTSTLLMFFKTAWHTHAFPDYPLAMLIAMLERAPIWALAGALIGLGGYFLRRLWLKTHGTISMFD